MNIFILVPSLTQYDAVGTDALMQNEILNKAGFHCMMYAQFCDESTRDLVISKDSLIREISNPTESNLIIYHHAVYWAEGEQILSHAKCKVHLRYHNITPPSFFRDFDDASYHATAAGIEQTKRLINLGNVSRFIGASAYNIQDLISLGANQEMAEVIAPFHRTELFAFAEDDNQVKHRLSDTQLNILFVGRVVPNKGHRHLVEILDRYVYHYGPNVKLHIVGSLALSDPRYFIFLENLINKKRLATFIEFQSGLSYSALHTYYKYSDVFLITSEHEGFCVPILEAQYHGLPIIALNRAAVGDTLGHNQLVMNEVNYDAFAAALHILRNNKSMRQYLATNGLQNVNKFSIEKLSQKTINLMKFSNLSL